MLDTNTVSYIVHGRSSAAVSALDALIRPDLPCISSITAGEILFGLAKNPSAIRLRSVVEKFLLKLVILPWGSAEAAAYGDLRAALKKEGRTLSSLDMLIAAHAIAVGATLITSDNAFRHVKELAAIENWATDL